jgi:elongation factor Ts
MAEISALLVKDLRGKTGAGMMDCKKALTETNGDVEAAIDWLRKKGVSTAGNKAGRVASEGLIGLVVNGSRAALVEVNAETDFVSRNPSIQEFVSTVATLSLAQGGDVVKVAAAPFPGSGRSVAEQLTHLIATIGENMALRRVTMLAAETGVIGAYMHSAQAEGLGRIGVLVALQTERPTAEVEQLAKRLAMHVAAANPLALSRDAIDPGLVERERGVLSEKARASGKPEAIAERMVEGGLGKFFQEACLLEQTYVIDGESKVGQVIDKVAKDNGASIAVTGFVRYALGEGIEKRKDDFAASVASAVSG